LSSQKGRILSRYVTPTFTLKADDGKTEPTDRHTEGVDVSSMFKELFIERDLNDSHHNFEEARSAL